MFLLYVHEYLYSPLPTTADASSNFSLSFGILTTIRETNDKRQTTTKMEQRYISNQLL